MKGIIFTVFNDMVEEKFGLETWETMLDKVKPESGGSYTAGQNYPDSELMSLLEALATLKNISVAKLTETFGRYMFPVLAKKYPMFLSGKPKLKDFLKSIDEIIHVEVRKLYPDAELPEIKYEDPSPNQLVMLYRSPRKLCHLAKGLIEGAAELFKQPVTIKQPTCMFKGAKECRLEITFV